MDRLLRSHNSHCVLTILITRKCCVTAFVSVTHVETMCLFWTSRSDNACILNITGITHANFKTIKNKYAILVSAKQNNSFECMQVVLTSHNGQVDHTTYHFNMYVSSEGAWPTFWLVNKSEQTSVKNMTVRHCESLNLQPSLSG